MIRIRIINEHDTVMRITMDDDDDDGWKVSKVDLTVASLLP
jgi:hypothetical protein